MSRFTWLALAGLVSSPALAAGHLADVSVIDRDSGRVLDTYFHQGEYWVAGRPGAHYAVRITSRDGRRLLAVTSVDGVNILTGETAAHDQRGYVFEPWQGYDVAGWRKSDSQIAAFTFTSIPKSYAARTGRPDNVGVIGVALFAEKPRRPKITRQAPAPAAPAPERADAAEAPVELQSRRTQEGNAVAREESRERELKQAPSLGTGHGRRERSLVTQVAFERATAAPAEIIRIRYDSRENLLAMGVIRTPRPYAPDPFPDSPRLGYVPDP
ncbi:MAG TPA: hypothetical protein VNQ32_15640 [Steroidobacteraceae bacterium]|nr:hypothetical protein [Steroidobacteraceae bacterium]